MADTPKLRAPRLRVVRDDGSVLNVQALNVDMLAWDRTRVKHGWPDGQTAPFVWLNFLAWSALSREQQIPQMTLHEFENTTLEVSSRDKDDDDDDDDDVVPPTLSGLAPD